MHEIKKLNFPTAFKLHVISKLNLLKALIDRGGTAWLEWCHSDKKKQGTTVKTWIYTTKVIGNRLGKTSAF